MLTLAIQAITPCIAGCLKCTSPTSHLTCSGTNYLSAWSKCLSCPTGCKICNSFSSCSQCKQSFCMANGSDWWCHNQHSNCCGHLYHIRCLVSWMICQKNCLQYFCQPSEVGVLPSVAN